MEAAGFLEPGDPRIERRVGVEERPEGRLDARRLIERVLDEHVRDRARRVPRLLGVELQLAQRQREAFAVAGDLRPRRVGEVLATA